MGTGVRTGRAASAAIYDLRHTYASFALDAGISIFELSRFMGCGVRVIDRTYGHLVVGSEARAREKLEARAQREAEAGVAETTGMF
jgi:hypothetical protein